MSGEALKCSAEVPCWPELNDNRETPFSCVHCQRRFAKGVSDGPGPLKPERPQWATVSLAQILGIH